MVIIVKELLNILNRIKNMVRLERLELSLGNPTWPSTKPVYQFQHSRACVRINE